MRSIEEIKADIQECSVTGTQKQLDGFWLEWFRAVANGIEPDRLEAICAAERDGRCVVLPCKVGDTVYVITKVFNGNKIERAIGSRKIDRIGGNALNPVWVVSTQPYELHFFPSEFGKTVFLTPAEAEAALAKQQSKQAD